MGLTTMLEEYERLRSWRYHFYVRNKLHAP